MLEWLSHGTTVAFQEVAVGIAPFDRVRFGMFPRRWFDAGGKVRGDRFYFR
jgi:hypothetical protein